MGVIMVNRVLKLACLVFLVPILAVIEATAEELSKEEFKKIQTRIFDFPPIETLNAMHVVCRDKVMDPVWPYDAPFIVPPTCINPNPLESKNLKRNKWFLLNDDIDYVGDPIFMVEGRLHPKTKMSDETTTLRIELQVIEDKGGFFGSHPTPASTSDPKIYQGFFDAIQILLLEGLDDSDIDGDW